MITPVDNVNFQGKFHFNGYSKHTPKERPYRYAEFMPELQTKNRVKAYFVNIINKIMSIF
jgi:hypothetical protein